MIDGQVFRGEKGAKLTIAEGDNNDKFPFVWKNARTFLAGMHVWDDAGGEPVEYQVLQDTPAGLVPKDNPLYFKPLGGGGLTVDYTRTDGIVINSGGLTAGYVPNGTIQDLLDDWLYPYQAPQAGLSLANPSHGTYLIGESFAQITMNGSGVKKTDNITKMEFYVNGVLENTVTYSPSSGSNVNESYTHIFPVGSPLNFNSTFQVRVTDVRGTVVTANRSINFDHKRHWGGASIDPNISNDTDLSNLVQGLSGEFGTGTAFSQKTITVNNEFLVVAFFGGGTPTFKLNGLPNTAFEGRTFNYTNLSGNTSTFNIWKSSSRLTGVYQLDVD